MQRYNQRNSSEILRDLKQAKWRLLMKLFLRLSEIFCLIKPIQLSIGSRMPRDVDHGDHWLLTSGRNAVTQRPSSLVTSRTERRRMPNERTLTQK